MPSFPDASTRKSTTELWGQTFIHDAIVALDPSKKDEYDEICQEPV